MLKTRVWVRTLGGRGRVVAHRITCRLARMGLNDHIDQEHRLQRSEAGLQRVKLTFFMVMITIQLSPRPATKATHTDRGEGCGVRWGHDVKHC